MENMKISKSLFSKLNFLSNIKNIFTYIIETFIYIYKYINILIVL
jgi:hypothetical protein